jgi:hypothetical protein
MATLDRRGGERRSGRNRRVNTTWATEILHQSHLRMIDLMDDFDDPQEAERLEEIRELALEEVRLHRALVEDVLGAAIREACGDPELVAQIQNEFSNWEHRLNEVERHTIGDEDFPKAWHALRRAVERHVEHGEDGVLKKAGSLPLDFVAMGLRMIRLREQVLAEKPDTSE